MSEWKETEYGKVPANWNLIIASEYCKKVTDGTHDSPKRQQEGSFLITSKHIKGRNIDFENAYLISEADFCKINERSKVDQWDVIISMIGEYCGFVYLERNSNTDYAIKNVGLFKTGDKNNAIWLYYYVQSEIGNYYLQTNKSGTSQPYITLGTLRELPILVPSNIEEQKTIAYVLSSLDDKIDLLHRQNKTLEGMAETLFRQWFVESNTNSYYTFEDLVDSVSIKHSFPKKTIIFLNTSDIYDGHVLNHNYSEVKGLPGQAKKSIKKGDILFTEIRPANRRFAYIDFDAEEYVVSTKLMVLRSNGVLSRSIVFFFLKNQESLSWLQMLAEARSGTFPQITFDDFKALEIYVPSENKLLELTGLFDSILEKTFKNQSQIRTLEKLRDTLLPKLMSGEVRVEI